MFTFRPACTLWLHRIRTALGALVVAGALTACQTGPAPREASAAALTQAQTLFAEGRYLEAAEFLWNEAKRQEEPQASEFKLYAVELALMAQAPDRAQAYLAALDLIHLPTELALRTRLAQARLHLLQGQPKAALAILAPGLEEKAPSLQPSIKELRAQALLADGQLLEAVVERLALDRLLIDEAARMANRQALWQALAQAGPEDLRAWQGQADNTLLSGWLALAYLAKTVPPEPGALDTQLADWQRRYPQHPANEGMLAVLREQWQALYLRPARIGVLLPLEGQFKPFAQAVLTGIMAGYLTDTALVKPELKVYPLNEDPGSASRVYDQAVADGAELIIGPLSKEAVDVLAARTALLAPVLSLNYMDAPTEHPNLYQFGLLPEDEAQAVAEHLRQGGQTRALAFAPIGEWGDRLINAFTARFTELGGQVMATERYNADEIDLTKPIQRAFRLDASEGRYQKLAKVLGRKPDFQPQRRTDVDGVFVAGLPRQTRQFGPQLKFHQVDDLPVYTTSHSFGGTPDTLADRDLEGFFIVDMPYILDQLSPQAQTLKTRLTQHFAETQAYPRLVALGFDAYRLVPYLKRLAAYPYERIEGLTGGLYMDERRRLHRSLTWAQFSGGRLRVLTEAQPDHHAVD